MQNGLTTAPNIMVGTKQEVVTAPEFYKTVGASLAYKYAPIKNHMEEVFRFGSAPLPEDGYIARKNIPEDLKPYGTSLLRATSQEHMDYLAVNLRTSLDRRNTSAESGFFRSFAAEAFDPVSYISIPLRLTGGIGKTALAAGTSTAAVVAGQEIARVPFDSLATTQETTINIGAAFCSWLCSWRLS